MTCKDSAYNQTHCACRHTECNAVRAMSRYMTMQFQFHVPYSPPIGNPDASSLAFQEC